MTTEKTMPELPKLPCPALSMPLHGKPSVYLYTADQISERDAMWMEKLRAAIAATKQEPVAFVSNENGRLVGILKSELPVGTDLFAAQPVPRE